MLCVLHIGRVLVEWVIDRCRQLKCGEAEVAVGNIPCVPLGQSQISIQEIFLHVWSGNEAAMKFYEAIGFEPGETIENYYNSLNPSSCIVYRKTITG